MENIISRELLSEVLGHTFNDSSLEGNQLYCYFKEAPKRGTFCMSDYVLDGVKEGYTGTKINVHELSHKCKEWAYTNGYKISVERIDESRDGFEHKWYLGVNSHYWFHGTTEPEAVFKACEWVRRKAEVNDN